MKKITETESQYIYIYKFFALLSIVASHTVGVTQDAFVVTKAMNIIMNFMGALGVGIFLIISGYLFASNQKKIGDFFKSKINTLIIPWIFCGTIIYLTTFITNQNVFNAGIFSYLLGGFSKSVVTPLYFLVVLMFLYVFYFYMKNNNKFLIVTIGLSAIWILFTATNTFIEANQYLNPLNFMIYFSLGILLRNNEITLVSITQKFKKYRFLLFASYLLFLIVCQVFDISLGYFGYGTLIAQSLGILWIFSIAETEVFKTAYKIDIGKYSYLIYLLHMPVAWVIIKMTNFLHLDGLVLLRPFLLVFIFYIFIEIFRKIKVFSKMSTLIGARG